MRSFRTRIPKAGVNPYVDVPAVVTHAFATYAIGEQEHLRSGALG